MPHLFVDISAHGFGHLAQAAPVLAALAARCPGLRLTIRSALPAGLICERIARDFDHLAAASDTAFLMHDATRVDRAASAAAYRAAHADWPARVAGEADFLSALAPDLVLADVSALPLAGARQAGIPAVALCSLNWADQFAYLFAGEAWAAPIEAQLHAAYAAADCFLRCTPAMTMADLANTRAIPPIARVGRRRRDELEQAIACHGDGGSGQAERLVVVAMGGIGYALPIARWPQVAGVRWLVGEVPAGMSARGDVTPYPLLGLDFSDLLASVDAVVTKPGYGMFVESAAAGTPLLYLRRADWPEQEALIDWLKVEATCDEVSAAAFAAGDFLDQLAALWARPQRAVRADGAEVATDYLMRWLGSRPAGSR
jgi:hypothetical protein